MVGETANVEETYPLITITDGARRYVTGYALRKGGAFHQKYYSNSKGYTASIAYRATEALLNYMEASYERMVLWTEQQPNIGKLFAVVLM